MLFTDITRRSELYLSLTTPYRCVFYRLSPVVVFYRSQAVIASHGHPSLFLKNIQIRFGDLAHIMTKKGIGSSLFDFFVIDSIV
jgi:hypothetical protein